MAKIAIDTQTTLGQKTGFGYYVENLTKKLEEINGGHRYERIYPKVENDFSTPKRFIWDQFQAPLIAKGRKADLFHQPAFSVPVFYSLPVVVTVHDLIAVHFGEDIPFWSRQFFGRWMPFSYRFADHIISISEYTKKDIMRFLNIDPSQITVIHHGVDEDVLDVKIGEPERKEVLAKFKIKGDYLLHVGTINPRKNLPFLVKVFSKIVGRHPSLQLVITGKKGWYYEKLFGLIDRLNLAGKVVFTGYISNREKSVLYKEALIYVFPSIYEGFGLPVLEAMACRTPVVSSNSSSMPEVTGDAGFLVDPKDEAQWVRTLNRLIASQKLRQIYIERGLKHVKKFAWKQTAAKTVEVYNEVLNRYNVGGVKR